MSKSSHSIWPYIGVGIIFGACFPLLALFITIREHDLLWSWSNVKMLHAENFLFYIIDSAPIVLGAVFAIIGVFSKHQIVYLAELSDLERNLRDESYNAMHKNALRRMRRIYVKMFFVVGTAFLGGLALVMTSCYHDTARLNLFRDIQSLYALLSEESSVAAEQMQLSYDKIVSTYNLADYPELQSQLVSIREQLQTDGRITATDYEAAISHLSEFHLAFYNQHKQNQLIVNVVCGVLVLIVISVFVFSHFYFFAPNFMLLQKAIIENTAARHLIQLQSADLKVSKKDNEENLKQLRLNLSTAESIRNAIRHHRKSISATFGEAFIVDRPLQSLSGDFVWYGEHGQYKTLVLGDCVGHGVAGTLLAHLYEEIIEQIAPMNLDPDAFIMEIDSRVKNHLRHSANMDLFTCELGVLKIDTSKKKGCFAGSNTDLIVVNGHCETYKSQRFSVGSHKNQESPVKQYVEFQDGDWVVMYSDGYKN
ncbi:MAG: Phosphoserine phosphatase RsbU, partial [Bacteroidota bacterium]